MNERDVAAEEHLVLRSDARRITASELANKRLFEVCASACDGDKKQVILRW